MEPIHKTVKDMKEAEKTKNSEEESESENPLETAVRKVVSYRMTPKQALSIYNLTPKVRLAKLYCCHLKFTFRSCLIIYLVKRIMTECQF